MSWRPDRDGWESARRRALAEDGLAHLERLSAACRDRMDRHEALAALIADVEGVSPGAATGARPETSSGTEGAWTPVLRRWFLERLDSLRSSFVYARDGVPLAERHDVPTEALPADIADALLPIPVLEAAVAEAERYADQFEAAFR